LYVFSGKHLLAAYLRPGNIDPAYGAWSILKLLSDRFREVWPDVKNWIPNQLRMLLSGLAYTLIEAIRRLALKDTELFNAGCGTIRLALFKIGAIVLKNTRRVQMLLSGAYPYKEMFCKISSRLGAT
jgi:hypothetical protein